MRYFFCGNIDAKTVNNLVLHKPTPRDLGHRRSQDFDWGEGKSHAMTSSEISKKKNLLWGKDIVEWKIRSCGLVWLCRRILLEEKGLNETSKSDNVLLGRRVGVI